MPKDVPAGHILHNFQFWRYATESEKYTICPTKILEVVELKRCSVCNIMACGDKIWRPSTHGSRSTYTCNMDNAYLSNGGSSQLDGKFPAVCPVCAEPLSEFDGAYNAKCTACNIDVTVVLTPGVMHWKQSAPLPKDGAYIPTVCVNES